MGAVIPWPHPQQPKPESWTNAVVCRSWKVFTRKVSTRQTLKKCTRNCFDLQQLLVRSQRDHVGLPEPHTRSFSSWVHIPRSREGQRVLCHGSLGPLLSLQVLPMTCRGGFSLMNGVCNCSLKGTLVVTWDVRASWNKER